MTDRIHSGPTAKRSAGWVAAPGSVGGDVDISAVGSLVADPARCRILLALADGRALPASRLAAEAGISPATASSHLGKLTAAGLLMAEASGRYRYYRLTGPDVGDLIEALERFAPAVPVRSLRQSQRARALREARTCYDHLAGRLSVELVLAMIKLGHLTDLDHALTESGNAFLDDFGVDVPVHRRLVRYHLDSSERQPHLTGALGRALLDRFVALDWIRRAEDSRAVLVTAAGRRGFEETFGLRVDMRRDAG